MTVVGIPACRQLSQLLQALRRRRGPRSMVRASFGSSVVTDSATLASCAWPSATEGRYRGSQRDWSRCRPGGRRAPALEKPAHDLALALDRLIRVGVGADRNHARLVILRRQFLFQLLRRVRLAKQFDSKSSPRRQAEKAWVGRAKAVDEGHARSRVNGLIERSKPMSGDRRVMTLRAGPSATRVLNGGIPRGSASRRRS